MQRNRITFFSIATGNYLNYWKDLIISGNKFLSDFEDSQWLLATDNVKDISNFIADSNFNNVEVISIPSYGWPDASLLRYEVISQNSNRIRSKYSVYLDADMRFKTTIEIDEFISRISKGVMTLQVHPGYYRPTGLKNTLFYLGNPKFIFKDILIRIKNGGLGTWESDRKSLAFVARRMREFYYCGGCWFGETKVFLEMCELLSENVRHDLRNGLVARFHDESHLNSFASMEKVRRIPPIFCFDPTYPNLTFSSKYLEAVNKNV
jgi:hypothetical protein